MSLVEGWSAGKWVTIIIKTHKHVWCVCVCVCEREREREREIERERERERDFCRNAPPGPS